MNHHCLFIEYTVPAFIISILALLWIRELFVTLS